MGCFYRGLFVLSAAVGPLVSFLSAYDESGFFRVSDNPSVLYYTPGVASNGVLPGYWETEWNLPLYAATSRSSDPLNQIPHIFEAQWTDEHYRGGLGRSDVLQAWGNDFRTIPFPEGNPLEDMERCGRGLQALHSRYGIQIVPCSIDILQLNFSAFPFPEENKNTSFAVKLYGAEWVRPWDDTPGLCRRSLPHHWVLRRKISPVNLNHIRLTSPESCVFAVAVQGPGINSDDPAQYGSLIYLYYVPKPGQALNQIDQGRSLLMQVLPGKLNTLQGIIPSEDWHWDPLISSLKPPAQVTHATATPGKATQIPDTPPAAPRPWSPSRETPPSQGKVKDIHCFADIPIRQSWLYQHQQSLSDRPFLEAVYVHAYNNFSPIYRLFFLANLAWDERAKGEALQQKCLECFNANALPRELQDFLFNPDAPFAKLRFQINIQCFMPGDEKIQCLRPHCAVANMPYPNGTYPCCLLCKLFSMKLYGASFTNNRNEGTSDIPVPAGFCSKTVHTHEGPDRGMFWRASPNNCQIAGTDNHDISRSFYSVVMGKCMQYCDDYRDAKPWDEEVTAIVTLHIVLEDGSGYTDTDIVRRNCTQSLSEAAKKYYDAWETKHQRDTVKHKNPFEEFHNLLKKVADAAIRPEAPPAGKTPPRRPMIRPVVRLTPPITPP